MSLEVVPPSHVLHTTGASPGADQVVRQSGSTLPYYAGSKNSRQVGRGGKKGTEYRSLKIESDILRTYVTHLFKIPLVGEQNFPSDDVSGRGSILLRQAAPR